MSKDLLPKSSSTEMQREARGEVISPDIATFIALDDMAVRQAIVARNSEIMRRLEQSKVPIGVKPIKRTVTDTIMKLPLYPPWISFSLINDGLSALTVWVNDEEDPLIEDMIASGESYECDMRYPVIHALYLKSESGASNAVRIYGKEGRP